MKQTKNVKRLTLTATAALCSRHPDTIMRRVRRGQFPPPLEDDDGLPTLRPEFDEAEVLAHIAMERKARKQSARAAA